MPIPPDDCSTLDRRQLLKTLAGVAAVGAVGAVTVVSGVGASKTAEDQPATPSAKAPPAPPRGSSAIAAENTRAGTRGWLLRNPSVDAPGSFRCSTVEGYCSATSILAGETLQIFVSARPASKVRLEVFRMGFYGGDGGRQMKGFDAVEVAPQPDPPLAAERLRECAWKPTFAFQVPADWLSGIYLGKLTAEPGGTDSYVVFIVRDARACDVLVQCSTNTWAAYDRWPRAGSLYDDGAKEWSWGPRAEVSFARPYGRYCQIVDAPLSQGSGEFLLWEFPLVHWLEQQGYDVSYTANEDTHRDAAGVRRGKLWVSVGHDEYWTLDMYRNVLAARDAGTHLAFLSGNTCFGLVDLLPDGGGHPFRRVRRLGQFGGVDSRFVHDFPESRGFERSGPEEALLIGAHSGYPVTGSADWTCRRPAHWLFKGTGMKAGDVVPGLVGWEWHGEPAAIPGLEVLASGPIRKGKERGEYTATMYEGPRGSFVFNGATIWWSDGLSEPPGYVRPFFSRRIHLRGPDPRVQAMTANLIARATGRG